jgi:hypothetical protein
VAVDGDELRVGDAVPVMHGCAKSPAGQDDLDDEVDIRTFFAMSPKDYIFSDTLIEAKAAYDSPTSSFQSVSRSVPMPLKIPLTREFGFFVGAYLSEGHATDHEVHISNNAQVYPRARCRVAGFVRHRLARDESRDHVPLDAAGPHHDRDVRRRGREARAGLCAARAIAISLSACSTATFAATERSRRTT